MPDLPALDIDPYAEDCLRAPQAYHHALHHLGPVVRLTRHGVLAVGRISVVETILRDWRRFCSARGVGLADFAREAPWRPPSIVLEVDPPAHARTRGVLAQVLSPPAVQGLRETMTREARAMVDAALEARCLDAARDLAQAFPLKVFGDAVGLPDGPRENLLRYGRMVFDALGPDNARRRASLADAAEVLPWIARQCARESLRDGGFGAAIYAAADAGEVSLAEAALLVRSLLSAGIDTTVATLGFLLERLSTRPAHWAMLRANRAFVPAAIDETLRHAAPVHTFCRTSTEEVVIDGAVIPDGSKVLCVFAAANRDPTRWESPDDFDPARPRRPHVAFGSGLHVCVGQALARLEITCLLEALLDRVARIEPTAPAGFDYGNAVNTVAKLPLELTAA